MALYVVLGCGQPAAYRISTRGDTVALERCIGLHSRSGLGLGLGLGLGARARARGYGYGWG